MTLRLQGSQARGPHGGQQAEISVSPTEQAEVKELVLSARSLGTDSAVQRCFPNSGAFAHSHLHKQAEQKKARLSPKEKK